MQVITCAANLGACAVLFWFCTIGSGNRPTSGAGLEACSVQESGPSSPLIFITVRLSRAAGLWARLLSLSRPWMFGRAPCAFSLPTTSGMGYIHCKRTWGRRCAASCGLGNSFWMCSKFGQAVVGTCQPNLIGQVSCKLRSRFAINYGKLASLHDLAICATVASSFIWSQHMCTCSSCSMLGISPVWASCFCR